MVQGVKAGRPKKPLAQKRTERVVIVLTPAEKQRLKQYIDKESVSEALREMINMLYKVELEGVKAVHKLDELGTFIREMGRVLKNKDIDITIKSKKSIIKIKAGHVFFLSPSATQEGEMTTLLVKGGSNGTQL